MVEVHPQFVGDVVPSRTVVAHKFIHDHVCQLLNVISVNQLVQLLADTQLVPFEPYQELHLK